MKSIIYKNTENLFVDVEGAQIEVSRTVTKDSFKIKRTFDDVGRMELGKFRRLFNRHRTAYGY